jgi:protein-disulfide isomerase
MTSCYFNNNKNTVSEKSNQIAFIDSIPINYDEVDNLCRQELFDELSRIHLIRKITLEEIIKDKILQLEANKLNITVEQLKNSLNKNKITIVNLEKFAKLMNISERVTELRETLVSYNTNSSKGQEILITRYKQYLLNQYIDSLKKTHQISISLMPPKSPTIKLDNLAVHYIGYLNSPVTFLVISDFDCSMCREHKDFFENLCAKYKDKVRFGFTHYSSYVSNSAIASECAANQGKFWEMHDSIFNTKLVPDSVALFRMAKNLKLNMNTFSKDYKNKAISDRIMDNLLKLESAGIYGTPTIMINNRLIFNSTSLDEIEKMLKEEIKGKIG